MKQLAIDADSMIYKASFGKLSSTDIEKQYMVYPGHVRSKNDNDEHYISARQLIELYEVPPHQCRIHNPNEFARRKPRNETLIILAPRADGKYKSYIESIREKQKKRNTMIPKHHLRRTT